MKLDILSKYNERFCTNNSIRIVQTYLADESNSLNEPSTFDKEMFLRFFEELDVMIKENLLDPQLVYDTFAYYGINVAENGKYHKKFNYEDNKANWSHFNSFIETMNAIKVK